MPVFTIVAAVFCSVGSPTIKLSGYSLKFVSLVLRLVVGLGWHVGLAVKLVDYLSYRVRRNAEVMLANFERRPNRSFFKLDRKRVSLQRCLGDWYRRFYWWASRYHHPKACHFRKTLGKAIVIY